MLLPERIHTPESSLRTAVESAAALSPITPDHSPTAVPRNQIERTLVVVVFVALPGTRNFPLAASKVQKEPPVVKVSVPESVFVPLTFTTAGTFPLAEPLQ